MASRAPTSSSWPGHTAHKGTLWRRRVGRDVQPGARGCICDWFQQALYKLAVTRRAPTRHFGKYLEWLRLYLPKPVMGSLLTFFSYRHFHDDIPNVPPVPDGVSSTSMPRFPFKLPISKFTNSIFLRIQNLGWILFFSSFMCDTLHSSYLDASYDI